MNARLAALCLFASCAASTAGLGEAAAYSAAHGETALLVADGRRVVFERGAVVAQAPRIFSITKSLVSIGVFRNALTGGISLGQPVTGGPASGVSLSGLLNQTSGLEPMSHEFYSAGLKDKARVLANLAPPRPSRGFVYGASHWEVLAEEIPVIRGTPLDAWVRKFVPGATAEVLGRWRRDDRGRMFFSTGARMSARELLSAGRSVLVGLGRGYRRWPAAVREMLGSGTMQNRMYALGFWLNREAASAGAREVNVEASLDPPPGAEFWRNACLSRAAPADLLAMIGTGGQRVYVVPSRDLVIIRLANNSAFSDAEFLRRYFTAPTKPGVS